MKLKKYKEGVMEYLAELAIYAENTKVYSRFILYVMPIVILCLSSLFLPHSKEAIAKDEEVLYIHFMFFLMLLFLSMFLYEKLFVYSIPIVFLLSIISYYLILIRGANVKYSRGFNLLSIFLISFSFLYAFYIHYNVSNSYEKWQKDHIVESKISKVGDIRYKLKNQLRDLEEGEEIYRKRIDTLVVEIKEEKLKYNISSLSKATERIRYNMKLLQNADAYLAEVFRLKATTESGIEESIFLVRMLEDKQTMKKMIGSGKSLSKEVDDLLKNYNPYTEKIAIKPENLRLKSMEEIWRLID